MNNLKELLDRKHKNSEAISKDKGIFIYGGKLEKASLNDFINSQPVFSKLEICILQTPTVSDIYRFDINNICFDDFIKCRIFGDRGDLSIYKDGEHYDWSYIGSEPLDISKAEAYKVKDYWEKEDKSLKLYKSNEPILFWQKGDMRVAKAHLNEKYEKLGMKSKYIYLDYWLFTCEGVPQFYWYKGLKDKTNGEV